MIKFLKSKNTIFILFLVILFSTMTGYSAWLFNEINQTDNIVNINNDEKCTITIHTRTQSSEVTTTTTYSPGPSVDDWTVVSQDATEYTSDSGNQFTHGQKHSVGQITEDAAQISSSTETLDDGTIVNTYVYQRKTVYEIGETYLYTEKVFIKYYKWWYKEQTEQRTETVTISRAAPVDTLSDSTITVKKGSTINPFELNITNYQQYGFYSDSAYSTFFDFSKPILEDTHIYIKYVDGTGSLDSKINGLSNSTLNIYDSLRGGSVGTFDLFDDTGYDEVTRTGFLETATINSGSTVNLTYDANITNLTPITGAVGEDDLALHRNTDDKSLALDYESNTYIGDKNCFINLKLLGDLTIKGTLVVGAKVGGVSASTYYSYIIGGYTQIDLNGHDLIVDGGTLTAYGRIYDSIGTGKILVQNNGKITAVLSVTDGRGRDQSVFGYGKGQTPFTEYKTPYIEVPVKLMNGCDLQGYLKLDLDQLGITNIYFSLVGPNKTNSMFSWNSDDKTQFILFKPYNINLGTSYPVSDESAQGNNTIYKLMYYQRNIIEMHADMIQNGQLDLSAQMILSGNSVDVVLDLARVDTPISPFFDIILKSGFKMDVYTKMTLYPGSSFITEKGSTLNFKYRGNVTYSDIGKSALGQELIVKGETRYISGGLIAYTKNINYYNGYIAPSGTPGNHFGIGVYANTTYWNYVNVNNHRIGGDITFDTTIADYYHLSGPISISESGLNSIKECAKNGKLKTYDMKPELYRALWFDADNSSTSKTNEKAVFFNTVPLISGDKAYIYDSQYQMTGLYDSYGVFTNIENDKNYYLWVDTDLYADGSASSNQGSPIDRNVVIKEITNIYNNAIIKDSEGSYMAYFGGIYVPVLSEVVDGTTYTTIRINARKFFSNKDASTSTTSYTNAPYYDDVTVTWSSNRWKYSKYTNKA